MAGAQHAVLLHRAVHRQAGVAGGVAASLSGRLQMTLLKPAALIAATSSTDIWGETV